MNRRGFLNLAGGAAGAGVLSVCGANMAMAGLSCFPVHSAKSQCKAGVNGTPEIAAQPCQTMTWATCLSYLLSGYGAELSETHVLERFGIAPGCGDRPVIGPNDLIGAAGLWQDKYGRRFAMKTERLPDLRRGLLTLSDARQIVSRVSRQPVLCGAAGYTTLLTQFGFDDGAMTRMQVQSAMVRDPWTETPNLRPLTKEELSEPSYLIAISVRPL